MTVDYAMLFGTLGAEFKNLRKPEAVYEDFHLVSSSNYAKRLVSAQYSTSDVYEDVALTLDKSAYDSLVSSQMQGLIQSLKGNFETAWFPVLDSQINTNPADKSAGAISYVVDPELTDGTVAILTRQGRWAALRAQMVADKEVILKNTIAFGSLVAMGENYGSMTLTSVVGSDHTLSGLLTLICVDDSVGAQKFSIQNVLTRKLPDPSILTSTDGLFSILLSENVLQVGKSFQDGPLGITIQIDLNAPVVTDPSSLFATPSLAFPGEADTNKGIFYIKVTRQSSSPIWLIQWFRDAAFTELVTQTSLDLTVGTTPLSMSGTQSLFTATFSMVNANTAMPGVGNTYTFTYNANVPRLNDQFTITVTNDEAGNFATKLAHLYRASLPSSVAKPSSAITGALAGAGAGNVDNGTHSYYYTYVTNGIETGASATSNVVTVADKTVNGKVSLTGISVGPAGTTARKVYRKIAGNTGNPLLLTTIADNTTTVYTDNTADSGLGTYAPTQVDDTLATSVSMT